MELLKKNLFSTRLMAVLFLGFGLAMGIGTFVESKYSTETARIWIYNAWWFEAIMVFFVINFLGNMFRYRLFRWEKWPVLTLHLSWILIIIGAFVTRYISFEGMMPIREGKTERTKRAAENILKNQGYVNVPATIDNDEWKFNLDYVDALALGDERGARRIAKAYLAHMKERTAYFQALAKRAMGRDVSHILLLHMNKINADHLDDLLAWYAVQGWVFVTVEQALRDPVFAAPDLYTGPRGISQSERVLAE